jgi:hypothetical protein
MRKSRAKLFRDLYYSIGHIAVFDHLPKTRREMTEQDWADLEKQLRESYQLWANTWIYPVLHEVEERWLGKRRTP